MAERYVKGSTVTVLRQDTNGQPLESIERDPDGQLWHVKSDGEPVRVRDDEVSSLVTEVSQQRGGGDNRNH